MLWRLPKPKTAVFVRSGVEWRTETEVFLEPSEDGFAVRRLYLYSVKLHEQTDGQAYKYARQQRPPRSPPYRRLTSLQLVDCVEQNRRTNGNRTWCILALKCDIWWQKCWQISWWLTDQTSCIYWLIPDFIPPPFKFLWSIPVRSPHRMDALDRHNGQRDKRTDRRMNEETRLFVRRDASLRPSVSQMEFDTYGIKPMSWFRRGDWRCLQSLHRS